MKKILVVLLAVSLAVPSDAFWLFEKKETEVSKEEVSVTQRLLGLFKKKELPPPETHWGERAVFTAVIMLLIVSDVYFLVKNKKSDSVPGLSGGGSSDLDIERRRITELEELVSEKEDDIQVIREQIDDKTRMNEAYARDLRSMGEDIGSKAVQIDKLERTVRSKDIELEGLKRSITEKRNEIQRLNLEIERIKRENKAHAVELGGKREDVGSKERQIGELERTLGSKDSELESLKRNITEKRNNIQSLTSEIERIRTDNENCAEMLSREGRNIELHTQEFERKRANIEILQDKIERTNADIEQLKTLKYAFDNYFVDYYMNKIIISAIRYIDGLLPILIIAHSRYANSVRKIRDFFPVPFKNTFWRYRHSLQQLTADIKSGRIDSNKEIDAESANADPDTSSSVEDGPSSINSSSNSCLLCFQISLGIDCSPFLFFANETDANFDSPRSIRVERISLWKFYRVLCQQYGIPRVDDNDVDVDEDEDISYAEGNCCYDSRYFVEGYLNPWRRIRVLVGEKYERVLKYRDSKTRALVDKVPSSESKSGHNNVPASHAKPPSSESESEHSRTSAPHAKPHPRGRGPQVKPHPRGKIDQ